MTNPGNDASGTCTRMRGLRARLAPVLVLVVAAACTQPPTGDEIIGNMLDALGPEKVRAGIRSLRTVAEGSGPGGLFVTSVTSIRPDAVYFHRETGLGTTEIWSTAERTWGGSRDEAYAEFGPAVRDFVRNHEFHLLLLDIRERFSGFHFEARDTVDDEPCLRVTMTGEPENAGSVCVRESDWLPLELTLDTPDTGGDIRIVFGDWEAVDGLELFHSFRLYEGPDDVFTYDYVEISVSDFGQDFDIPAPTPPTRPR